MLEILDVFFIILVTQSKMHVKCNHIDIHIVLNPDMDATT